MVRGYQSAWGDTLALRNVGWVRWHVLVDCVAVASHRVIAHACNTPYLPRASAHPGSTDCVFVVGTTNLLGVLRSDKSVSGLLRCSF